MEKINESVKSIEILAKQNQIMFQLKDGTVLLLHKEDYETIVMQIKVQVMISMMKDWPDRVYVGNNHKTLVSDKIDKLYDILKEQKETMSEELKSSYLNIILELSKEPDCVEIISHKDKLEQKS